MTERREQTPAADAEMWSLVEALTEGSATAEQLERLNARLRAEPDSRKFYVAYLDMHAQLQWRTRGQTGIQGDRETRRDTPRGRRLLGRVFGARWRVAIAAALVLAVGLVAAFLLPRRGPEEAELPELPAAVPGSIAVLIDNRTTVWERDMTLPTETGSALPPGRLKLKAGVVEIAFHGGGEVRLEGPADLDVSAPDRAYLHRGKLVARVPEGGPAFQISTPGMVVTDLSGECGLVSDDSGVSEVHVFEGRAGADPTDGWGEPLPGVRLNDKVGARLDAARRTLTAVPLNELAFAHLRPDIRVADVTVRGGQFADRNFGTASRLVVKNSIADYTWDTYLRFDLSGVKGKVREATVRLVPVRVGQPLVNAVALVPDNRWSETAVTWDSKPASGPAFDRWTVEEGKVVEFDVTPLVEAALATDKKLSLRIFAPDRKRGSSFVEYGSRRGDIESRPQLLLTLAP
jgi:hypothetical protein